MKASDPKLWLGAASLGFVLALFYNDLERTSPGPISRVHGQEAVLADGNDCARCHGAAGQEMASACIDCHAPIGEQITLRLGFHGTLPDASGQDCAHCHLEHHGPLFDMVGPLAFRGAGFESREDYDHRALGFSLAGAHARLECVDCHEFADADLLAKGQARFLGLSQACDSCHEDPHDGNMSRECAACHGQEQPFVDLAAFLHSGDFELDGAHASASCVDCHDPQGSHAVDVLAGRGQIPASRACSDCHEDPHAVEFLAAIARMPDASTGESCERCHDAAHDSFADDSGFDPALHAATGFDLSGPHDVPCSSCHADDDTADVSFASRFPGREASDCAACHEDPHDGLMGNSCVDCHVFPHPFTGLRGFEHTTSFALAGRHAGLACADCHDPATPYSVETLTAGVLPTRVRGCVECHESPHSGDFESGVAASLGASVSSSCAECHDPLGGASFRQTHVKLTDAQHSASGFPLDAPHDQLACDACHDGAGETFAERYPGRASADCSVCHVDPHGHQFVDGQGRAQECTNCHGSHGFLPSSFGVAQHAALTFSLEGSHRGVACFSCHELPGGDETLPRTFARTSSDCAACHLDAHGGSFDAEEFPAEIDGERGCARCHTETEFSAFLEDRFDHGQWTAFELTDAHAVAACEACHAPERVADRTGRRFGRALGRDCAACHSDPHVGQFAIAGVTDCTACHTSTKRFGEIQFEHDTDSVFPLDDQHRDVACATCHRAWPLPGGGAAVRYKPLGKVCGDCHTTEESAGGRR